MRIDANEVMGSLVQSDMDAVVAVDGRIEITRVQSRLTSDGGAA